MYLIHSVQDCSTIKMRFCSFTGMTEFQMTYCRVAKFTLSPRPDPNHKASPKPTAAVGPVVMGQWQEFGNGRGIRQCQAKVAAGQLKTISYSAIKTFRDLSLSFNELPLFFHCQVSYVHPPAADGHVQQGPEALNFVSGHAPL